MFVSKSKLEQRAYSFTCPPLSWLNLLAEVYTHTYKKKKEKRKYIYIKRKKKRNGHKQQCMLIWSIRSGIDIEFYVRFLTFWDKIRRADRYLRMPNGFSSTAVFHVIEIPQDPSTLIPIEKIFPTFASSPFKARDSY